ncbi:MAG: hypothetical protein ACI87E_003401 [Mariniblastus sp.]|jgi:hypothetical protein
MSTPTHPALDRDTLYAKSQVYIRRGFRAQSAKDNEEYQLWASLSLELLGKAALAHVHPALVADPQHYQSVFAACGRQISSDTRTITAKTLYSRLGHLEKAFDKRHQEFCNQISIRRNSELHSGESPFSGMSAEAWEREFWGAAVTLLEMQGETLESWLGTEEAKAPAKIAEQAEKALEWGVKARVTRFKEDFEKSHQDPEIRKTTREDSIKLQSIDLNWDSSQRATCPACQSHGFLWGTLWGEEVVDTEDGWSGIDETGEVYEEWPMETVEKSFSVEAFWCPVCQLKLYGTKEIASAELPDEFTHTDVRELEYEPDYGND